MKQRKDIRAFAVSFYCTLCVLILAIGILEADYHSRQTGFGDGKTLIQSLTGRNWRL